MPRGPVWSLAEDEWLRAVPVGSRLPDVTERYNAVAQKRGWPVRSQRSVEQRWRALVPRRKGYGKNIAVRCVATGQHWASLRDAAEAHGRSPTTLGNAIKKHGRWGSLVLCDSLEAPTKDTPCQRAH